MSTSLILRVLVLAAYAVGTVAAADVKSSGKFREIPEIPEPDSTLHAYVTVDAKDVVRSIPSTLYGQNLEWIWNGNGVWDVSADAPHSGLLYLARELRSPLYRFPGGIMADYYDWRLGIGPPSLRRPMSSMPGGATSFPAFGTDEAIRFAGAAGARLLITVNAGTGTPELAADWVRHVNSGGELRAEYWEIGNELYVNDGSEHSLPIAVPPAVYAVRVREFARAMRGADPRIKIGAILAENYNPRMAAAFGDWTDVVLRLAGSEIDFVSVHNAYAPGLVGDDTSDVNTVYAAMLAAPKLIRDNLASLSSRIDALDEPDRSRIKIAITEWGPWFNIDPSSRFVEHGKTLASAVFVASTLKAFVESPKVSIANAFHFVDGLFLGWIGWRNESYLPKPSWFAMQMYTTHFGDSLVRTETQSPEYDSPAAGLVDAVAQVPFLEAVSSVSSDRKTLYIIVINKHLSREIAAEVSWNGVPYSGWGTIRTLWGPVPDATTGTTPPPGVGDFVNQTDFDPSRNAHVELISESIGYWDRRIHRRFSPASVSSIAIPLD